MTQPGAALTQTAAVAYFSMEVGLESAMPTYSGGLGVLAGDTLKAAADLGLPMVAVTLVHRKGYFKQSFDDYGNQLETDEPWSPEAVLDEMAPRVTVKIEGQPVQIRAWRHTVQGSTGSTIALYLLDTDLPENSPEHRKLTDHLYGGDLRYRLCQEVILGIGGTRMLQALDYDRIRVYHMNEGHSALLTMALLETEMARRGDSVPSEGDIASVKGRCVFTTHTPVPAGHDQFDRDLVGQVLDPVITDLLERCDGLTDGNLNMTYLALRLSRYANAVAFRHGQISREMFPGYDIAEITNGVHAGTWVAEPMAQLFDRHLPGWRHIPFAFRHAIGIPLPDLRRAHDAAKRDLFDEIKRRTGVTMNPGLMTIAFARRAARYKRPELLFRDKARLRAIAESAGPFQVVISGKAHPADQGAKWLIQQVHEAASELRDTIPVVYLEDYNMGLAAHIVAGVDLWLNNPQRPLEASGTSGMKAAMNGVPSLSTLDGWWIEGHVEGVTGWSIGTNWDPATDERDAEALYNKLEMTVLPTYYRRPELYADIMRSAIALNGSFFNAQRMVLQYSREAYRLYTLLQV